jgi:dihydrofolate reductase
MKRVIWHVSMSLDGFIAGPGDSMDWVFRDRTPNPEAVDVIGTIGAALAGRRMWEIANPGGIYTGRRRLYGGAWQGPVFILTHNPPATSPDPDIAFLSGDIRDAVATGLAAAGEKDLLVLGATTARQCLDAGLVDDILVHLIPVLLGDGVRFLERPGPEIDLETVSVTRAGGVANLRYKVLK